MYHVYGDEKHVYPASHYAGQPRVVILPVDGVLGPTPDDRILAEALKTHGWTPLIGAPESPVAREAGIGTVTGLRIDDGDRAPGPRRLDDGTGRRLLRAGIADTLDVVAEIQGADGTASEWRTPIDIVCSAPEETWPPNGVVIRRGQTATPAALASRLVTLYFSPETGEEADSRRTQKNTFFEHALATVAEMILPPDRALEIILDHAVRHRLSHLLRKPAAARVRWERLPGTTESEGVCEARLVHAEYTDE